MRVGVRVGMRVRVTVRGEGEGQVGVWVARPGFECSSRTATAAEPSTSTREAEQPCSSWFGLGG